ncbi:MAG: outer membrane beta-barrel protein [Calditrichaeota bacterium]|nr:outer membrane beta-barrel protein [Calditrichota bacterium]MCB0291574.1 outer membrane beta-barrel protein [Calditrichota bacterium]MCB0305473.1 outer membrane beta-barrel protein [Calditrichota bacterium]MCB9089409.1 outer membrane beta-barrel protein [Calditrichia bacterium]
MNKWFYGILCLICIFFAPAVWAQSGVGLIGGLNFAGLSVKQDNDNLSGIEHPTRTAFGAGGMLCLDVPGKLLLQMAPLYLQQGSKLKIDGEASGSIRLAYLNLPLLLRYNTVEDGSGVYFAAGPNIALLLDAVQKDADGAQSDIKDLLKGIDVGLNFSAGISAPLGGNFLFIEAQFGLGVVNIDDSPAAAEGLTRKTSSIKLMGGMLFPFGR